MFFLRLEEPQIRSHSKHVTILAYFDILAMRFWATAEAKFFLFRGTPSLALCPLSFQFLLIAVAQ
jgi:hypothetical protein